MSEMEKDNIVLNENDNEEEYQQPQEGKTIDEKEIELTNIIEENVTPEDGTEKPRKADGEEEHVTQDGTETREKKKQISSLREKR